MRALEGIDGWGNADDLLAFEGLDAVDRDDRHAGRVPQMSPRKKVVPAKTPVPVVAPLVGSAVTAALEAAWADIVTKHPGVPADVVLVVSGARPRESRIGHFWGERWQPAADGAAPRHEVWVSAQHLVDGAEGVLETLLHEAAHAANHAAGVKDCAVKVHNRAFAARAQEFGLLVGPRSRTHGLAHTTLAPGTAAALAPTLDGLRAALGGWRLPDGGGKAKSKQRLLRAACPECGAIIRLSASVMESSAPKCGACDVAFELVEN